MICSNSEVGRGFVRFSSASTLNCPFFYLPWTVRPLPTSVANQAPDLAFLAKPFKEHILLDAVMAEDNILIKVTIPYLTQILNMTHFKVSGFPDAFCFVTMTTPMREVKQRLIAQVILSDLSSFQLLRLFQAYNFFHLASQLWTVPRQIGKFSFGNTPPILFGFLS